MKKEFTTDGLVSLSTDKAHVLHDTANKKYPELRQITVKADAAERYEELTNEEWNALRLEKYKSEEYSRRLSAAVHERYSMDDEIALGANVNSPSLLADESAAETFAEEYAAYQAYRQECKARVRAEIDAITEVPK